MEKQVFACEVQTKYDFDVVVIGGGTTGSCAAVAAARGGARTAIVEYFNFLGGTATCGLPWMNMESRDGHEVIKGIPREIVERLREKGGALESHLDPFCESTTVINPTQLKMVLGEMMKEASVKVFFHSLAIGVEMAGKACTGVYIQNKQGCQLLKAKVVIDCTDTGDVAVMAGAEYTVGRKSDNKVQISSTVFTIGDINMEQLISYFERNKWEMRPHGKVIPEAEYDGLVSRLRTAPAIVLGAFKSLIAQAKSEGIAYERDRFIGVALPRSNEILTVAPRIEGVDPNDVENISAAELEGYSQIAGIMEFVKKYLPGGENARIVASGHHIGIRETKHIVGEYMLTGRDLLEAKQFDDVIAVASYHLDIHSPDNNGLAPYKRTSIYQIPYRSLLPKGVEGVLVAGRCVSADHDALSAIRVIPISAAEGHAAGTAAAIAVKNGVAPGQIEVKELQQKLVDENAELGQGVLIH